jgi:hypothetical protein
VNHRPETVTLGRAHDLRRGMHERLDSAGQSAPEVSGPKSKPHPPDVARKAECEQAPGVPRRGADQEIRVGVAADDAMHDHDVRRVNLLLLLHEVSVPSLDPPLGSGLAGERARLFVIAV